MLAVNYSTIRNHLKDYCDKASDYQETVIITRKNEKNIVLMSLDKYNQLEKAAKNNEYLVMIDRDITQLKANNKKPQKFAALGLCFVVYIGLFISFCLLALYYMLFLVSGYILFYLFCLSH